MTAIDERKRTGAPGRDGGGGRRPARRQREAAQGGTAGRGMGRTLLGQPRAVWAVAFACVVSFMGIGLVDPILPVIAEDLHAGPAQVSLLFTSYMLVTGIFMLVTGWVSSRLGAKATLMIGLVFVVVFAGAAGLAGSVSQIVMLRGGWGIGNALFIATALATIVGVASGGAPRAVMLYEAAMGIGMAAGPLLGGLLGQSSWRGPFFGTATLMAIAFILVAVLLPSVPRPPVKLPFKAPFVALKHTGLLRLSATAFVYNMGFFVLLSQAPYPLEALGAIGIGLVFFAWGVCLALASVLLAPVLARRFGRLKVLMSALGLLVLVLGGMALSAETLPVFIACVVAGGIGLGTCNTLLTESVMEVSDVPSSVASAGYSAVRFTGGAIATCLAGWLTAAVSVRAAMAYGALAEVAALVILALSLTSLRHVDSRIVESMDRGELAALDEAAALTAADA